MTLRDLNEKYFELYSDLSEAKVVLPEKQYDEMSKALSAQYRQELDTCVNEYLLEHGQAEFELRYKVGAYMPRRRWWCFWRWNKVGKIMLKRFSREFEDYLLQLLEPLSAPPSPPKQREDPQTTLPAPISDETDLKSE